MMTRKELLTNRGYWVAKIHIALWIANGSIKADSNRWEEVAEKVVDDEFMKNINEVSEKPKTMFA